jgi:hypothetical protein
MTSCVLAVEPVVLQQVQVEVETLALYEPRESTRTEDHWGQARTSAQTFLRAAVTCIDAPLADIQRNATKGTDASTIVSASCPRGDSGQLAYGVQHAPVDVSA